MATVAELETDLAAFKAARDAILSGAQSYSIGGRSLTRANLDTILKEISRLEARIDRVGRSGRAVKAPVFEA
jgi:hypothetical protein